MRRTIFALIAMLGLPATMSAQYFVGESTTIDAGRRSTMDDRRSTMPTWSIAPRLPSRDPLPTWAIPPLIGPPSVGLPLPPIGAPLPSIGLQPQIDWNRRAGKHRRRTVVVWPPMVFVVSQAAEPVAPRSTPEPTATDKEPAAGTLVLQVQPGTAQVLIDGYYAGTPDDFNAGRGELVIETGPHSVELSAPGYETVSFDVRISPNQSIVYRRVLKESSPFPQPSSLTSQTFYVIPGCYLGNVPPIDAGLPSTCDLNRAIAFTPK